MLLALYHSCCAADDRLWEGHSCILEGAVPFNPHALTELGC